MGNTEPIQYIGIEQLTPGERETLDKLSAEYYNTIQRSLKNLTSIIVHIKEHSKSKESKSEKAKEIVQKTKRKKFSVLIRVVAPTKIFEETTSDWDFARTLHKSFKSLERQIQHRLHTDDQRPKSRG